MNTIRLNIGTLTSALLLCSIKEAIADAIEPGEKASPTDWQVLANKREAPYEDPIGYCQAPEDYRMQDFERELRSLTQHFLKDDGIKTLHLDGKIYSTKEEGPPISYWEVIITPMRKISEMKEGERPQPGEQILLR